MDFSKIDWKAVVPAGLIIWVLSLVVNLVIGYGYSFIIGFQTRGDMEAIQEASLAFTTGFVFKIIIWVTLALLTYWRAGKVATAVAEEPLLNALAAGVIAMLVSTIVTLVTPGFDIVLLLVSWLVVLGVAFVSASTGAKEAVA